MSRQFVFAILFMNINSSCFYGRPFNYFCPEWCRISNAFRRNCHSRQKAPESNIEKQGDKIQRQKITLMKMRNVFCYKKKKRNENSENDESINYPKRFPLYSGKR